MALLVERVEELTKKLEPLGVLALLVNTHDGKIAELQKDSSGDHKSIERLVEYMAHHTGSNRVLYAVIMIFAGFMSGIGGTALSLFFQDSKAITGLTQQVTDLRTDVNIIMGGKR